MDGKDDFGVTDASENEERGPVSYWGPGGEEGVKRGEKELQNKHLLLPGPPWPWRPCLPGLQQD